MDAVPKLESDLIHPVSDVGRFWSRHVWSRTRVYRPITTDNTIKCRDCYELPINEFGHALKLSGVGDAILSHFRHFVKMHENHKPIAFLNEK